MNWTDIRSKEDLKHYIELNSQVYFSDYSLSRNDYHWIGTLPEVKYNLIEYVITGPGPGVIKSESIITLDEAYSIVIRERRLTKIKKINNI